MLQMLKDLVLPLLEKLNTTSVKRLVIYFMLGYPLVITYLYKDEIKLLIFHQEKLVTISNIADAQNTCFALKNKYFSETVSLYVYQPAGKNKTHKERMAFSTGTEYQPLEALRNVNLYSRSRIIEDLRRQHYAIITKDSKHDESAVLVRTGMAKWIITPIIDNSTGIVIGEVYWLFKNDVQINIDDLISEGQIFSILLEQNTL